MDTVRDVLGKFGKKVSESAKKTEVLAGDVWQHCKFSFYFTMCKKRDPFGFPSMICAVLLRNLAIS